MIPKDGRPASYLEALLWAVRTHRDKPADFAAYQASSVEVSRVLDALLTGGEYLRQINRTFD